MAGQSTVTDEHVVTTIQTPTGCGRAIRAGVSMFIIDMNVALIPF